MIGVALERTFNLKHSKYLVKYLKYNVGLGFMNVYNNFPLQKIKQREVESKEEVASEMSELVVYCQPRSKDKDRFGTAN